MSFFFLYVAFFTTFQHWICSLLLAINAVKFKIQQHLADDSKEILQVILVKIDCSYILANPQIKPFQTCNKNP
jgi:hypothetical protein